MEGTKGEVISGWKELEGKERGEVEDGEGEVWSKGRERHARDAPESMSVSQSTENPGKAAERSYFTGLTRENDYSADLGLQIDSIGGKSLEQRTYERAGVGAGKGEL
ncbi:hypothetical protein N7494_007782 [Penicillium frequentans]|uniref:Uncharacterized protein n=1 Tax=Penicillium frequentans TaxID=3151616 RepID=A0AAD6GD30_9EURO|nr:hypothetical protein N7494_007782 [Penicillium glabrum]